MIRSAMLVGICCFAMAASPASVLAQANPNAPGRDPRVRRALREQAVASVGPACRDFVETHDEAVAALFACSKPVAVKLCAFHAGGGLATLPRPHDLLLVIAKPGHGDEVALFAIDHASELADRDSFDAYVVNPLVYALSLKKLETGAAEMRARRLSWAAMRAKRVEEMSAESKLGLAGGAFVVGVIGIVIWRRRRAAIA